MPAIRFQTNVAVELHMKALDPKTVESQFGGNQHMFVAQEGAFYVSETVGGILTEQFRKLGVKAGEPINISKQEVPRAGGKPSIQWVVSKVGFAVAERVGERGDGTFAVSTPEPPSELEQQLAASLAMVEARKQAQRAAAIGGEQPKWAQHLSAQAKHLVDVYAELVGYAAKHGNTVRPEDVRALMTTAFINLSKSGANSNAA